MTETVNLKHKIPSIAPLTNVHLCRKALNRSLERGGHLPGLTCFYGPAGYGKTKAIAYAANDLRAYAIEAKSHWTRKGLLSKILFEMGLPAAKTLEAMVDQICEHLALSGRPLIIDEFDHLVNKGAGYVELIRDIYDASAAPIMLVGEENLPNKLKKWDRFYGRVLEWTPAQPPTLDDAKLLRELYCQKVNIADDLVEYIHAECRSTRLVAVNLDRVQAVALDEGLKNIDRAAWADRSFYHGDAPIRR